MGPMDSRRVAERVPDADPPSLVVRGITPAVDAGRYAVKRLVGDELRVGADIFKDGHDTLAARALVWPPGERRPTSVPLSYVFDDDRWYGTVPLDRPGEWRFTVEAWTDRFASWRNELEKKVAAAQDVGSELIEGAELVRTAEPHARGADHARLLEYAAVLGDVGADPTARVGAALSPDLHALDGGLRPSRRLDQVRGRVPGPGRPARRGRGGLVRVLPPLADRRPAPPRHLRRRRPALPAHRGAGLRRRLPAADPPDRPDPPQGPQQRAGRRAGRSGQPLGDRERGRRSRRRSTRRSARWPTSAASWPPRAPSASRWRSTTRCSARPIIPGSGSTRSGSSSAPTAPSSTPRTRPRSTRTSIRSTSGATTGRRSGTPAATSSGSGSATASAPSGWTTRTPSRSPSGSGSSPTSSGSFPTWSSWPRRSPGPSGCRRWPSSGSPSRTPTSPGATARPSSPSTSPSWPRRRWRTTSGGNFFANTPDILHEFLQEGGPPAFRIRLLLAGTLSPLYGIYSGFELFERTPVRAGSEEYLDSEKYQLRVRDWSAAGAARRGDHPAQPGPPGGACAAADGQRQLPPGRPCGRPVLRQGGLAARPALRRLGEPS